MTGFGRARGSHDGVSWQWEVRSVNGRGLDVRLRLPPGFDALEASARTQISGMLTRGSVNATLSTAQSAETSALNVNEALLARYAALAAQLAHDHGLTQPSSAELLGLRGVLDAASDTAVPSDALLHALQSGLKEALQALVQSRREEGSRLVTTLTGHIDRIEALCLEAETLAATQPEVQRAKLQERLDELLSGRAGLDPARLEQEVALLALRSDVREELDRLAGHITAARALLGGAKPAGRPLDFLVQEFNRETNTLCSKAVLPGLTRLGLDLKAVIDQLREQVQNLE